MSNFVDELTQDLPKFATGGIVRGSQMFGPGGCVIPHTLPSFDYDINIKAPSTAEEIVEICDGIKSMLLEKNRKYGDSALSPTRVFSKADSIEQIKVRIDDKLSRLRNAQDDEDEDVVSDLMGYLVLLRIAQNRKKRTDSVVQTLSSGVIPVN